MSEKYELIDVEKATVISCGWGPVPGPPLTARSVSLAAQGRNRVSAWPWGVVGPAWAQALR